MTLPIYLAMTAAEMSSRTPLPEHCAYMACHFSPYGTGLSDLPAELPEESILIINDRIPVANHDPQQILKQINTLLKQTSICAILLDLQQKGCKQTQAIACAIAENIHLPVGVSEHYATGLSCPVFISAPALHVPLSQHLLPWSGREIWLDAALNASRYTIRQSGCSQEACSCAIESFPLQDQGLHCHYRIQRESDAVIFTLQRTSEDLQELLAEGQNLGVTKAIGLYQEYEQAKQLSP